MMKKGHGRILGRKEHGMCSTCSIIIEITYMHNRYDSMKSMRRPYSVKSRPGNAVKHSAVVLGGMGVW